MAQPFVASSGDAFEHLHVRPKAGRTLICGSRITSGKQDRRKRYEDAVGWDAIAGDGVDRVIDLEESVPEETFAHIECTSVLEHSRRPWLLAANVERLLEVGGSLYVAAPFVWKVHEYPGDYWRFTAGGIMELFPSIEWDNLIYGCDRLRKKVTRIMVNDFWYLARSEVFGFGRKRG